MESVLPPTTDMRRLLRHVRFVPISEVKRILFQHRGLDRIRGCSWSRSRAEIEIHTQLDCVVLAPEGVVESR
jgi:hypothetical protein